MPVNLSIKDVPEEWVARLRERAKLHHRSMQGELLAILEPVLKPPQPYPVDEVVRKIKELGIRTNDDSTAWIREDRDAR